jgi:hypothetical protein
MARRNSLLVSRTLYQVGVVTLIVAVIWVGVGVYGALNKETNAEVDKKILEPINPTIDKEVVQALSTRLVVETVQPITSSESAVSSPSASIIEDETQ